MQVKHTPVEGHTSMSAWVAQTGRDGFCFKEEIKLDRYRIKRWILETLEEGNYAQNTMYEVFNELMEII